MLRQVTSGNFKLGLVMPGEARLGQFKSG